MNREDTIARWMTPLPQTIGRDQTLAAAQSLMDTHRIRHLPVLHGGRLIGLLSERDVGVIGALNEVDPSKVRVEEAMSAEPWTVLEDTPVRDIVDEMIEHKYGSAVVTTPTGQLRGIFTTHDALRVLREALTTS